MASEKSINDLSPYELARLERIKRNENRLRELGLVKPTPKPKLKPQAAALVRKRKQPSSSVPTRSSRRLRELKEGKTTIEDDENGDDTEKMSIIEEDTAVDYNPQSALTMMNSKSMLAFVLGGFGVKMNLRLNPIKYVRIEHFVS